jgi:hypothetical protein
MKEKPVNLKKGEKTEESGSNDNNTRQINQSKNKQKALTNAVVVNK